MKHILKVDNISEVASISTRPLIAADANGNLFFEGRIPGPIIHNDEIHYTATEKITPHYTTVFGANYLPDESEFDETTYEGILKFDNDVTQIGESAFWECADLTSITIPNNVTIIGDFAFQYCNMLSSVSIPNSVTSIGWYAFDGCSSLNSVTIPNSVISIGESAFMIGNSTALKIDITFVSTNPITLIDGDGTVINIFGDGEYATIPTIHVPTGYEETYATHDAGWEALAQYIVRP